MKRIRLPLTLHAILLGAMIAAPSNVGCTRRGECSSDEECPVAAYCLLPEGLCFARDAQSGGRKDAGAGQDDAGTDGGSDAGSTGKPDGGVGPVTQQPFCNEERWCWVNPKPAGYWLQAVDGVAEDEAWAVGWGAPILRWNGHVWTPVHAHDEGTLADVIAVRPGLAFAAGAFGTILRWDGESWKKEASATSSNLLGLFADGEEAIWAAGEDGSIVHFNGSQWKAEPTPTQATITSLWNVESEGMQAFTASGEILQREAQGEWTLLRSGGPAGVRESCLFPTGDGWAVTASGEIWERSVDAGWELKLTTPAPVTSLACLSPDDVWAGTVGGFLRWNGKQWESRGQLHPSDRVHGIWRQGDFGLAVGAYGFAYRWAQGAWVPHSTDAFSRNRIQALWATGTAVYVGLDQNGRIFRCTLDGNCLLVRTRAFGGGIQSISGTGPESIWAGGDGELVHWNGMSWTSTAHHRSPNKVHASQTADGTERLWLVSTDQAGAYEPVVERCEVDTGVPQCSPVDAGVSTPADVWSDGDRVWVASKEGHLSVCSEDLDCILADAGTPFVAISGSPGPVVVAISSEGRFSKWIDGTWTHGQVPGAADLIAVAGPSEDRFWVLDSTGTLFRKVPEEPWHSTHVAHEVGLNSLTVLTPSDIWSGGSHGSLMRFRP